MAAAAGQIGMPIVPYVPQNLSYRVPVRIANLSSHVMRHVQRARCSLTCYNCHADLYGCVGKHIITRYHPVLLLAIPELHTYHAVAQP